MGDMREDFDLLKKHKKTAKKIRMKENLKIINESGIDYTPLNNGLQLNFYIDDLPCISFYPSTGAWTMLGKTFRSDAKSFLNWLKKIKEV